MPYAPAARGARPARGAARFDLDEARLAAQLLVGEHDFASFANTRANEPDFLDTVRTVRHRHIRWVW